MNKLGKKKTLIAVSLLSVLAIGLVFAVEFWSKQIDGNIHVVSTYTVNVYSDSGHTTPLSLVNFDGDIDRLSTAKVNGTKMYLWSSGSGDINGKKLHVSVTSLPSGFSYTNYYVVDATQNLKQTPSAVTTLSINATSMFSVIVELTPDGTQVEGTYTPQITLSIQDS